jgi:UDP-glucose 4-epimerase
VGISVKQVIEAVERVSGRALPVRIEERRLGDAPFVVAESALIRQKLGWDPKLNDIDLIVSTALEWEKTHT